VARRRRNLVASAVLLLAGGLTGCRTSGLEFGQYQLRFVSPGQSSEVTLPLRLSWTAAGLYQPGDSYAVFVDT
jgi:hypothetical protein